MKRQVVVVLLLLALPVSTLTALPRFASRTGSKCQSCHVNPSGGAMRQSFGVQYGRETLPVPEWSGDAEMEDFSNIVANFLGVGADFRTLYFYQQIPDTSGGANGQHTTNAFWQMQGDLYINLRVAKKVNLFLKKGLYSGFEVFGLLTMLPAHGHLKIGKFVPNYGTKIDDHTAYIRTVTGFSPATGRPELTGLEAGISPGDFNIVGGFYNAEDGFGSSVLNNKALLGRAEGVFSAGKDLFVSAGGSIFDTKTSTGDAVTLYGAFGSVSYRDLTVFGEADWKLTKASGGDVTAFVSYIEADYVLIPGLDLKLAYDFYDPDLDQKDGGLSRYSVGIEFFPLAGVEIRPVYRFVREQPTDLKSDEFHLLLHFYI